MEENSSECASDENREIVTNRGDVETEQVGEDEEENTDWREFDQGCDDDSDELVELGDAFEK